MRKERRRSGGRWLWAGAAVLVAGLALAAYRGVLGPLLVCGADRQAVCVAGVPPLVGWLAWLGLLAFAALLLAWQVRETRAAESEVEPARSDDR